MTVKCIPINGAAAGMVLARPVVDGNGRTLCGEKTLLTETIITHLQRNNITGLFIASDERLAPEAYEKLRAEIEARFSKIDPGTIMHEVKTVLLERLETKR
jgi:hypothetical protein